jgi:hypothetical protein
VRHQLLFIRVLPAYGTLPLPLLLLAIKTNHVMSPLFVRHNEILSKLAVNSPCTMDRCLLIWRLATYHGQALINERYVYSS